MAINIDRQGKGGILQFYSNDEFGIKNQLYAATVQFREDPIKVKVDGKQATAIGFAPTDVTTTTKVENWKGEKEYQENPMTGEYLIVFAGTSNVIGVHPNSVDFD
jgi:hypothetical protein